MRKASIKTVKRKSTNRRKRRKIMAATRKPNIQLVNRVRSKQNGVRLNVFHFQLNRNVFHRYDDEFFVRNLESTVDKASNEASQHARILHLHYCTWGQQIFAFFFGPVLLRDFVQGIFSALFDEFII